MGRGSGRRKKTKAKQTLSKSNSNGNSNSNGGASKESDKIKKDEIANGTAKTQVYSNGASKESDKIQKEEKTYETPKTEIYSNGVEKTVSCEKKDGRTKSCEKKDDNGRPKRKYSDPDDPLTYHDRFEPDGLHFDSLSLSDEKENDPLSYNPQSDSLLEDGYHGLEAIDRACRIIYPFHGPSPIITSPAVKYWLGGALPLDYVKIYFNGGDPSINVDPHWHYISFGLSDLYGDDRLHDTTGRGQLSGYGFELTFRLKKHENELGPPAWPITILNELATYCFNTATILSEFDHIPWNQPLDKVASTEDQPASKITHLLLVEDPKMLDLDTPNGTVRFLQVVGVVEEEMQYTRAWTTGGVVDYLLDHPQVGRFMLTDMKRETSIFELKPELRANLLTKIEEDGSNLTNISAHVYWFDTKRQMVGTRDNIEDEDIDHIFTMDQNIIQNFKEIESINIHIDNVAAEILPVIAKGRLRKNVTFVLESPSCVSDKMKQTIFFVPHSYKGPGNILVNAEHPMMGEGGFLQIFCTHDVIEEMASKFVLLEEARQRIRNETLIIPFTNLQLNIIVHRNYKCVIEQHKIDKSLNPIPQV